MKRLMGIMLILGLLMTVVCAAETWTEVDSQALTDGPESTATAEPYIPEPTDAAEAEAPGDLPAATSGEGRELSGYFGGDIATAAAELGGLEFEAGEEYTDNYIGETLALRGNGGVVTFVDLRPENEADTLCGIKNGMSRDDAIALMEGCPMMWDYPEEIAWLIRADTQDELRDEILVVFFDETSAVAGAWYRVAGM